MKPHYTLAETAALLGKDKETLRRWDRAGKLPALRDPMSNYRIYPEQQLSVFRDMGFVQPQEAEGNAVQPTARHTVLELFAGAGGLAVGLEKAGLHCVALNEWDKWAAQTLRQNRPEWTVLEGDIRSHTFGHLRGQVDVVTGGFPCQAFSYAGKKLGLEDARGTLFYEFARAVAETQPMLCIGENVRGLVSHDHGRTLEGMISILDDLGYHVQPPRILRAVHYKVPQKRERLFLVGVRKDLAETEFHYPRPYARTYTLRDALLPGDLYDTPVPQSEGMTYPRSKYDILAQIPQGGYWRDLPPETQRSYMGGSYLLSGGKTGMARRIAWDEPCLTPTCSPAQKQTERCHPDETRPFTVREYARIQTLPDTWAFAGPMNQQYKQIGNAVPVNLGREIGYAVVRFLNAAKAHAPHA